MTRTRDGRYPGSTVKSMADTRSVSERKPEFTRRDGRDAARGAGRWTEMGAWAPGGTDDVSLRR